MIRVTEALDGESTVRAVHTFQEAVSFDTGRHGELLIYSAADSTHPQGETIAAFAENCWDLVEVNPTTEARSPALRSVPTGSSAPSTTGPSTASPSTADPGTSPADLDTPGGSRIEGADLVGAESVMTEPQPWDAAGNLIPTPDAAVFGSGVDEGPPPPPVPDPGMPAGENMKVVMDGQGQPVVLRRVMVPDAEAPSGLRETWLPTSPDDIPAGVPAALIEDRSPAQQ